METGTPQEQQSDPVSSAESGWLVIFAVLVLTVVSLPYLLGYSSQGSDWRFTGFVLGVDDGNSYIAKMLSGSQSAWVFRTPYTAFPQNGVIAFLPYLLLGKLAGGVGLHEQLVALFHLFRIFAGWCLIRASYDFAAYFLHDVRLRRWAIGLIILGGGLGWTLLLAGKGSLLGSLPLEFYSPESFGFLSLFTVPHLALGRAVLLWALLCFMRGVRHAADRRPPTADRRRAMLQVGLLWLLAALLQPLYALILGYILVAYLAVSMVWFIHNKQAGQGLADWLGQLYFTSGAALIPAPFILYNFLVFSRDPFLKAWTAQNIILSPHVLHYLLAYGLVLFFVAGGLRLAWRGAPGGRLLLAAWAVSLPLLAYLPVNLQRRLPEGIWAALVILALVFIETKQAQDGRRRWRLAPFLFLLAFPSTLLLLAGSSLSAVSPALPIFRPLAEVTAFQFLAEAATPGDLVLASFETGNALPAWADVRVVIGHGPESVGLSGLRPQVEAFYRRETRVQARLDLLRSQGVDYVMAGPLEQVRPGWDAGIRDWLQPVYDQGGYAIYRVADRLP